MSTAVKKKAIPKKVAIVKPNNTITCLILEKELKKMGYDIIEDEEEGDTEGETRHMFKLYENDDMIAEFQMTSETLHNCCGVKELGGFEFDGYIDDIPVRPRLAVIAYALLSVKNDNKTEVDARKLAKDGYPTARPVIFTTNGIDTCAEVEKTIAKYLKKEYKIVSETINPGSGNIITVYISTN